MNNKLITQKNLLQLTAIIFGAAILTIVTQRSFNSVGTVIDKAINNKPIHPSNIQ